MSPPIAWGRQEFKLISSLGLTVVAGGYGIMRTTPSEEEFYNALAPDLKRKVDEIRAQRASSQEMRDKLAASAAEDKVIWADSTSTKPRRV
ncbi:hypothetical protein QFC20_006578 [Naganishia adeliensis]|uniref:Uncharacterized protein n=1 Tax=Naganishia adeliensis TaxID=92952 RepID=A0ACC2V8T2_9TREE|nr:hypothetical protein QFC20_006578 [Naganishia adeliensis]